MSDLFAVSATPGQLVFLVVSALVAGLARGFSGFGAAMIFVPLGSVVVGPAMAAPLLLAVDYVTSMGLIPRALRLADRRSVSMTLVGALVGIPLGVYLLASYDPLLIRWAIVLLVAMMLILLISGWHYPGQPTSAVAILVGGVAGVLTGVSQMSGPPLVAFWLSGTTSVSVVRANIIVFYAIATLVSAASYYWWGLLSFDIVRYALILAIPYGLGLWFGARMFGLASELTFRRVCYVMIAAAGIVSVPALDGVIR